MTVEAVRVTIWHTPRAGQTTMFRQFRSDTRDVALNALLETVSEVSADTLLDMINTHITIEKNADFFIVLPPKNSQ